MSRSAPPGPSSRGQRGSERGGRGSRRRPSQGRRDQLGSGTAEFKPARGGHAQWRCGWCSERLERFNSYGAGFLSQATGLRLRLALWVPEAGKLGPAASAAAELQALKPERPSARLGEKAAGATACTALRSGHWSWGSPAPPQAGEPPASWPLIVGKLDAPGKVQLVEGGLRFPLLNFPGLPGRPPPPFLTRL